MVCLVDSAYSLILGDRMNRAEYVYLYGFLGH